MKTFKPLVALALCGLILPVTHTAVAAQVTAKPLTANTQHQTPQLTLCPDPKVSLNLVKSGNGMVTINGTVTNVGKGDYNIASVAQLIMNLSYAPQYSYAMTGVSDILATKPFTTLKAGASFTVNATYQIPDFGGWAMARGQGNANRLFTLRVVKQDMSPYKPGEDCNAGNNSASAAVAYRDTKH